MLIAALPMYDFEELRPATDALWAAIATHLADAGIAAPHKLTRTTDLDQLWQSPSLLLAQTCGLPFVTSLKDRVSLVAAPRYTAPGCTGANYRSAIVVRATDPAATLAEMRGRCCAINSLDSNSGMNLLRHAIAPFAQPHQHFFSHTLTTGSHAASIRAVAQGRADIAAIDCITWAHLQHLRPAETQPLRVLAWTAATPGLPLITASGSSVAALRRALNHVAHDPALSDVRAALLLDGYSELTARDYEIVDETRKEAVLF